MEIIVKTKAMRGILDAGVIFVYIIVKITMPPTATSLYVIKVCILVKQLAFDNFQQLAMPTTLSVTRQYLVSTCL